VDPLKAFAATLFCLVLFALVLRLTRRLMEMAITAGHAEALRRAKAEEDAVTGAAGVPPPAASTAHAAGAVP
jgi:hypothetical protein